MAIKLYRCSNVWVKLQGPPCWKVQSALDDQGIEYVIVNGQVALETGTATKARAGRPLRHEK